MRQIIAKICYRDDVNKKNDCLKHPSKLQFSRGTLNHLTANNFRLKRYSIAA